MTQIGGEVDIQVETSQEEMLQSPERVYRLLYFFELNSLTCKL